MSSTTPRARVLGSACAPAPPQHSPQRAPRRLLQRVLRVSLPPAAVALAVLLAACVAWLHGQSCAGPLAARPEGGALGALPLHQRRPAAPAAPGAPQVDIVYVSAFPQHLRSSLRSLCHFLRPAGVGSVHLVVPDRMVAFFEASLPALQCPAAPVLAFRVWAESALVPAFTQAAPHKGTVRQMALKLAAASIVGAPFYLVMDSDVYARRPFGVEDLLLAGGGGGPAAPLRARTGLDQLDFAQPESWFRDAAALLRTPLVADTGAFCAARAGGAGAGGGAVWFAGTGNATPPLDGAFPLLPNGAYGACRHGRGHATHVTPMLLSRELVLEVLQPRLAAAAGAAGGPSAPWYAALLDYQALREAQCWQGLAALWSGLRFYTWTEYSLYFVAGVASGALDQYHVFPARGGITSYRHSIMLPSAYDAADWDAIFTDAQDDAPFFIVHSWFNKPLEGTNAHLARHIPSLGLGAEGSGGEALPQPSALPLYA